MRILIVTPPARGARTGNQVTAARWAHLLRQLGHQATIGDSFHDEACDLLIAIHARKTHAAAKRYKRLRPEAPLVVALAGTDLYDDLPQSRKARESLRLADRLVVLQPQALRALPPRARAKARVIAQSARRPRARVRRLRGRFEVCVLAHLRPVKDPLATARAARLLPARSRVRVTHAGAALDPAWEQRARGEAATNPRYRWLGDVSRGRALALLARSRLLSLTSRLEGGANVISEAIACSVPILATRIPGVIGTLGSDYPGYFPFGNLRVLAALLERAEADRVFYRTLAARCARLRPLVRPERELRSWRMLTDEIARRHRP